MVQFFSESRATVHMLTMKCTHADTRHVCSTALIEKIKQEVV